MSAVPLSLEEAISPEWLSEALSQTWPGTTVSAVTPDELLHGVGTKAIVSLTYADDVAAERPASVCVKAGYEPHNKHLLDGGTYLKEARFYAEIAAELPVTVPKTYFSAYDPTSKQGLIVMENLNTVGAVFGSAQRGYTVEEAMKYADALAALHARFWNDGLQADHSWLIGRAAVSGAGENSIYTDILQSNLDGERGEPLPAALRDSETLTKAARALGAIASEHPSCLIHGDTHARNLYFTADGTPAFFDWQTTQGSFWALDISYYLGAGLSHEDRRSSIESIFRHYLDRLAAHGATPPAWDEAWLAFRQAMVYGFWLWAITRPIVQPNEVINVYVDRLGNAAADLDSYSALEV
jgi:hypothetical protein